MTPNTDRSQLAKVGEVALDVLETTARMAFMALARRVNVPDVASGAIFDTAIHALQDAAALHGTGPGVTVHGAKVQHR